MSTLEAAGFPPTALSLPSVGANPAVPAFHNDVTVIRSAASRLISEGKDVVAVMHSYREIPGTEALQGLGEAREDAGAVIDLIHIASMVPRKGDSFEAHVERLGDVTWNPATDALTKVCLSAIYFLL